MTIHCADNKSVMITANLQNYFFTLKRNVVQEFAIVSDLKNPSGAPFTNIN